MSTSVWTDGSDLNSAADTALKFAARFWFVSAVLGQWIFVVYVAAFYGGAALHGDLAAWNKGFSNAHVPGHTLGNAAVAAHLLLAVIVMVGGPLQLIPRMRSLAPSFHRWNGRVYMLAVCTTSIAGLYMVWSHSDSRRLVAHVGVSLDAVLIIVSAALALRYVLVRDLRSHRRWALRLFMLVNSGWFFRVGLMSWIFLNRGPAGFDVNTFTGPFINFLSFADYLLPLVVLELYFRTGDGGGMASRFAMSAALIVLTLGMGIGIAMATMAMWLPRMM